MKTETITYHCLVETKTSEFKTEHIANKEHAQLIYESLKEAFGHENVYAMETRSKFISEENDTAF